jgi:glycine hydroxymethyltransferase
VSIKRSDPELFKMVEKEKQRQTFVLNMIASENTVSQSVMEAQGSILTNKYAEGYPSKRYYGGCDYVDLIEDLAISRAKKLFSAKYANVQPHSGSQANMAVYFAMLNPGDCILAMDLSHGGHLTHGAAVSFSGRLFDFKHYGLSPDNEQIDFNQVEDLAKKYKPKLIVAGASAYPRIIEFDIFSRIARSVDALLMVDMAHIAGLVAAEVHPSPIGHADIVTSTTHKTLRGPRGGLILSSDQFAKKLNSQIFPGIQGGPLMHIIAAKATAFKEAMSEGFVKYQRQVVKNAKALASVMTQRGYKLVTGGTDNHMVLVDFSDRDFSGKDAEELLGSAGITVNKNSVPNEKRSPFVTSGIRIGLSLITNRGLKENNCKKIAGIICDLLDDESSLTTVQYAVKEIVGCHPLTTIP